MARTRRLEAVSFLFLAILSLCACSSEMPKPSYTRTMLKVSRSLPGETEELKVRTSDGNLATLIVKRRDKSSITADDSKRFVRIETKVVAENTSDASSILNESRLADETNEARKRNEVRKLENAQVEQIRETFSKLSEPKIDKMDVNQTEGEQVTSESNRSTIGSLIDYGNWTPLDAAGRALIQQPTIGEEEEEYRNWKPLQTSPEDIGERRTSSDRFDEAKFGGEILLARSLQDQTEKIPGIEDRSSKDERALYYTFLPRQSRPSTRTNIGANLSKNRDGKTVPPEVTIRSEINVKAVPKRSAMSLDSDGTPVIHGTRMPDEPIDKVQTWRNARVINNNLVTLKKLDEETTQFNGEPPVISSSQSEDSAEKQRFEKFFKDVNRRYGRNYDEESRNVYFEWDPRNYKNEALSAEVYDARNDQYRANARKRMLHPDGVASYPISQRYTPSSQTIAPVVLKSGARAPVLQYAHPELGVQPAKILKNEKRRPDNFPENQHSFTEQRHKKKYVLNDKNIVDSYTTKNYYPNQHFYGLKRPNDAPFWVKISENLKNQFSTGVERVSQFTKPVIDPLVEATHKISQNLGLSNGKEAQNKIDTVGSSTSILIPALGLVASGAALGIGAVAVGRYLDVDVLKRSKADDVDMEHKRALEAAARLETIGIENSELNEASPQTLYVLQNVPRQDEQVRNEGASSMENDGVFLVLEEDKQNAERVENRESKQIVDEKDYVNTSGRQRRSLDYLDIFKMETDMRNLIRSKRLQRKGADAISEIVEIDLPVQGRIGISKFLIPKNHKERYPIENTILIAEPDSKLQIPMKDRFTYRMNPSVLNIWRNAQDIDNSQVVSTSSRESDDQRETSQETDEAFSMPRDTSRILESNVESVARESSGTIETRKYNRRQKRRAESGREAEEALQNLEDAEVTEATHLQGDWMNTPCAKRIFCDTMILRGHDASMFMEKKMAALLRILQPAAAVHVSSHFEEVMRAIRRHDCSSFSCPQAKSTNVYF